MKNKAVNDNVIMTYIKYLKTLIMHKINDPTHLYVLFIINLHLPYKNATLNEQGQ